MSYPGATCFIKLTVSSMTMTMTVQKNITMFIINTLFITFLDCVISIVIYSTNSFLLPVSTSSISSKNYRILSMIKSFPTLTVIGNMNRFDMNFWFTEALFHHSWPWISQCMIITCLSTTNRFTDCCFPVVHLFKRGFIR